MTNIGYACHIVTLISPPDLGDEAGGGGDGEGEGLLLWQAQVAVAVAVDDFDYCFDDKRWWDQLKTESESQTSRDIELVVQEEADEGNQFSSPWTSSSLHHHHQDYHHHPRHFHKEHQLTYSSSGKILEVLYATEDGFAVPADEEEEGMPPPPYDFWRSESGKLHKYKIRNMMGVPCLFVIQKRTFFCLTLLVSTIICIYRQQWKFRGKCDGTKIDPYHSDQPSLKMKGSKEERDFWSSLDIWRTKMQNVSTPSTPLHQLVHKITPSINEKDDAWSKNTFQEKIDLWSYKCL